MGMKKSPMHEARGVQYTQQIQPTIRPTEYRCYIKEDNHHYGAAGAESSSWALPFVRRSTPHPAALDARFLLCSPHIIVYWEEKVNRNCQFLSDTFRTNLYRYVYIKCRISPVRQKGSPADRTAWGIILPAACHSPASPVHQRRPRRTGGSLRGAGSPSWRRGPSAGSRRR